MASTRQNLPSRRRRRSQPADLAEYQQYWDQVLGNPADGLVGIVITLVFFVCLISLPWLVSRLQDEGVIHPRIHLRSILPVPEAQSLEPAQFSQPSVSEPLYDRQYQSAGQRSSSAFGKPRSE